MILLAHGLLFNSEVVIFQSYLESKEREQCRLEAIYSVVKRYAFSNIGYYCQIVFEKSKLGK